MIRSDWSQIAERLSAEEIKEFAREFLKLGLAEGEEDVPVYTMGIIHGAAAYLPDVLEYLASGYSHLPVKIGSLTNKQSVETIDLGR